jgi:serine/threonine protein phosphatase PrpC
MPFFATAAASYRDSTEDRALVLRLDEVWVVCVADGTGGATGGAMAADLFVTGVRRAAESGAISFDEPTAWADLIKSIDDEIARHPQAGETTGIALAVTPTSVLGASAGDSRAWLFSEGSCELTKNQSRKPRPGTGRSKPHPFTVESRGILVVGTDGLFDHASLEDIRAVAGRAPSQDTADALAQLPRARSRTLPDDVAVVLGWLDEREGSLR